VYIQVLSNHSTAAALGIEEAMPRKPKQHVDKNASANKQQTKGGLGGSSSREKPSWL
jgi:hypothetical protein